MPDVGPPRVVSVLFVDIAAYSTFRNEQQIRLRATLEELIRGLPHLRGMGPTDYYADLRAGDSAVLVFFHDLTGPMEAALQLTAALHARPEVREVLRLRSGLHVGPVLVEGDGIPVGEAINMGQRIASAGAPGDITASRAYVDMLAVNTDRYDPLLGPPRTLEAKHGRIITVQSVGGQAEAPPRTAEIVLQHLRVTAGAEAGRVIPLTGSTLELGRGEPAETVGQRISFAEPTVSRVQATLHWDGGWTLRHVAAATNPTLVNDRVVTEQSLHPGDRVRAGHLAFVLESTVSEEEATGIWELGAAFELRVERGDARDVGEVIPLTQRVMLEGRRLLLGGPGPRQNDVLLHDAEVANAEARLEFRDGGFVLVPEADVQVNGIHLRGPRTLQPRDRIRCGGTTLVFDAAGEASCWLELPGGGGAPRRHALDRDVVRIGRSHPCEVVVSDKDVSRLHATVELRGGGYWLRHESATNPTLVNGVKVVGERRLEHGDEIQLSERTRLHFIEAKRDVLGGR